MIEFKKILLTTDMSPNAEAAVPYAIELARKCDGEILVTHVFNDQHYLDPLVDVEMLFINMDWFKSLHKQHEVLFESYTAALREKAIGISVRPFFLLGNTAKRILELAKSESVDIIVISTHGRTGFDHLSHGSVAEKIVRLSPHPVLTIHPQLVAK